MWAATTVLANETKWAVEITCASLWLRKGSSSVQTNSVCPESIGATDFVVTLVTLRAGESGSTDNIGQWSSLIRTS